jgi:hypothetical protein
MADSTIDSELIILRGGRFGTPYDNSIPPGGFTGSTHHNVASPVYPIGMVKRVYNDGSYGVKGYSEFVYLQATNNPDVAIAAKTVCVPGSATVWYTFTNDPDDCVLATGALLGVVAISAMTDNYYGWLWCGGVCPEALVLDMGGNYLTDGSVVAGGIVAHDLTADAIGFGACGADTEAIIGYALAADA